jgi:uncharacterized membrane protein
LEDAMSLFSSLVLGFTAGLRSMSAPAAASWATRHNDWSGTPLAFLNRKQTPVVLTALAIGELVADKLPFIPDRTSPPALLARVFTGALSGAACDPESPIPAGLLGAAAAVAGTFAGSALRGRLASSFGRDLPAAFTEDALVLLLIAVAVSAVTPRNQPGSLSATVL